MTYQHKELSRGRWKKLSFLEQMANIGSEVERTINWKNKKSDEFSKAAFGRALELIDLTIADEKNRKRLSEISKMRKSLINYFLGKNQCPSSDKKWKNYFYAFGFAAAIKKGL